MLLQIAEIETEMPTYHGMDTHRYHTTDVITLIDTETRTGLSAGGIGETIVIIRLPSLFLTTAIVNQTLEGGRGTRGIEDAPGPRKIGRMSTLVEHAKVRLALGHSQTILIDILEELGVARIERRTVRGRQDLVSHHRAVTVSLFRYSLA
jgi:hypothetical protein